MIVAESICYMPFDHGFHHERTPYPLSETTRFFLSLCFCPHCQARARKAAQDASDDQPISRDATVSSPVAT